MFDRDYALDIADIEIRPPMRVVFDATKSISGGLNKCSLSIYNLTPANRKKLLKQKEEQKTIAFALRVGYAGVLRDAFRGHVMEAKVERSGTDFITTVESLDGGADLDVFVSKTATDPLSAILADSNTGKGTITTQPTLARPKVLVGNVIQLVEENATGDWFIDAGKLNILKQDEAASGYIPVVDSSSGLIQVSVEKGILEFTAILNPAVMLGRLIELESVVSPHLNGKYKVEEINYKGDFDGQDWYMFVKCRGGQYATIG